MSIYVTVSSIQEEGSGEPLALPLAAEAWADDLLSRLFGVLANLEAPEHRASDQGGAAGPQTGGSFLLSEQSMYR